MRYRAVLSSLLTLACAAARADASTIDCERIATPSAQATVCRVDVRLYELHIFLDDAQGRPLHTFANLERMLAARGERLSFAMNAGMFHPNFRPVGLLIEQSQELAPLTTAEGTGNFFLKPNGVFYVAKDSAHIVESSLFPADRTDIVVATQSGPLLVNGGVIHPRLSATSTSRFVRNGVGIDADGTVVFAATEAPQTLYEFAVMFRDTLHCPDALYLDGSITSIYAPSLQQRVQRAELGPIIAIVEPQTSKPSP